MNEPNVSRQPGALTAIVGVFLESKITVIFMIFALLLGAAAILITPREEDPQIVVPLADIYVQYPGASAQEIEQLVATPLEQLLWQIDGVEYVYSMSRRGMAVVTVRFFVGEDMTAALVRLHNQISMHIDRAPAGIAGWVIKPVSIDDVAIVTIALSSDKYDDHALRRIGEEVLARLERTPDISRAAIVGGRSREIRVELDPQRLAGSGISPMEVFGTLKGADASLTAGTIDQANRTLTMTSDAFIASADEVERLVVGVHDGRPVYLRDVARVIDGPIEATSYSRISFAGDEARRLGLPIDHSQPAVTLALSKKKGTNAILVANNILARLDELKRTVIPDDVVITVTRNSGETAQGKVNDLLSSLVFAIITVVALIAFVMGWREGLVVAVSVPVTFALCLFVNYLFGYTINRVTLFALILSLGLVVDDPITNIDNIQRHILARREKPKNATLTAVSEVLPPVIMSTLAIIASFLPMFFITGMMGPYMGPMAINVPLAVTFSTVSALTVVPWLSHNLLKNLPQTGEGLGTDVTPPWLRRFYRRLVGPLLDSRGLRTLLYLSLLGLLIFSLSLAMLRKVPLKMLPFDNKSEFQIVVDTDEGTTLEGTDGVVRELEDYLRQVPEVINFTTFAGNASPMDFNGLVRHYYMRQGGNVADIRVNLVAKEKRRQQSHEIVLRLRKDLEGIGERHGALVKLVETPPGPPVIATITTEIYGEPEKSYEDLIEAAASVQKIFIEEELVVDVDSTVEAPTNRLNFVVDKEKSALHGISSETILNTLRLAVTGLSPATVHLRGERHQLPLTVVLPRTLRSDYGNLGAIGMKTASGSMVELAELGKFVSIPEDQTIYHKNLERVVYVFGDTAGQAPAEAILDMQQKLADTGMPPGTRADWTGEGEWHITLTVFRDLGIAFGAALLGIYLLLIIQTGSYSIPWVIMTAIPLTLIGIMPGFWLLNILKDQTIGGFHNPVFFTATSMIGMIALGGIVVRNSIVLIEFIDDAAASGMAIREAILESGAVRMRPILLTALTTAMGAWPITLDPIFSGLAWALIFGLFASTLFTLIVVPVVYAGVKRVTQESAGPVLDEIP